MFKAWIIDGFFIPATGEENLQVKDELEKVPG
jgi:hypothetical protein